MSSFWLSDTQKIGVAFCTGGGFFMTAGVFMFFDRAMLAMGNILFLFGLPLIIGAQKTVLFFARRQKLRGTAAFAVGIVLILLRWAFVGFVVEAYGIGVLFGDFLWTIAGYVQGVPVIGPLARRILKAVGAGRNNSELPV